VSTPQRAVVAKLSALVGRDGLLHDFAFEFIQVGSIKRVVALSRIEASFSILVLARSRLAPSREL